jgi:steroid delta-isomerase-like uncharacterized protein
MRKTLILLMLGLWGDAVWAGPAPEQNKLVARRVFEEIFNQGKFAEADETYAQDFVNHGLHRNIDLREDQDAARGWKLAFPDRKITVVQEVAEGDLVTVLWASTGTNTGEGNGFPATGKKMQARGITIWRIVNRKITEEWSEFDRLGPMQQLGLVPADTEQN